ncbi:MAG: transcription termination factor NusA [Candidatus Moraniibacteriota bacterium]|jgi:N utilization substance protein A
MRKLGQIRKPRKEKEEEEAPKGTGDFGSAISALCEEKGISKEKVIETIAAALAAAYKKDYGKKGQNIRAEFDEVSGGAKFYLVKEVVDETTREFVAEKEEGETEEKQGYAERFHGGRESSFTEAVDEERLPRFNPERDLTLEQARKQKKKAVVGDIIETVLPEEKDYGRVAAQTAKQVIIQRIREAERDSMFEEYKNKEGEVISGVVQRVEGRNVFIDIGKSVGVLFPGEQVERENYRIGQRVKVYLAKVDAGTKGPGITLSRVHPDMVRRLFELEVPEIFAGTVEIKAIAREAGERTKVAVASTEEGIDPIGSCVGQKGTRVQAIIEELGGEKIDIILWNEDIAKFISAALSPAKVLRVDLNEAEKKATTIVPEEQLSLAIGKRGQNVRLAAKLTGWKIDIAGVKSEEDGDASESSEQQSEEEKSDVAEVVSPEVVEEKVVEDKVEE